MPVARKEARLASLPRAASLTGRRSGAAWPVRAAQRAIEAITVPLQGEHFTRRLLCQVRAEGLQIVRRERFKLGLIERLAARKPAPG
jgi:hypothetical protein